MRRSMRASLWEEPSARGAPFRPETQAALPAVARRYLEHAIAPGTPAATAVRLEMRGELRLGAAWHPFHAEQVTSFRRGFVWSATVRMMGLPVVGSDRWVDGDGRMRWRLLGVIPLMTGSGPDISRSAADRAAIEAMWLPSVMLGPSATWSSRDDAHAGVDLSMAGTRAHCELEVDGEGRLRQISMLRWGSPDGKRFEPVAFGAHADEERTFQGFTIPSRLRAGWYFGSERFESDGEFFRCVVEKAAYR